MTRLREAEALAAGRAAPVARYLAPVRWSAAVVETSRPRQWPKNLLVFAAPLAGASLGRDDGPGYALVAAAAFVAASAAVYFVNDVTDAERDRRHPVKRHRAVAAGRLPESHALAIASLCTVTALAAGFAIAGPGLSVVIAVYLAFSMLYTLILKHIPVVELVFVAAGFVLRALGGAIATHVPPSAWFLIVCSLGALMVALAKRYTELAMLGAAAGGPPPPPPHGQIRGRGDAHELDEGPHGFDHLVADGHPGGAPVREVLAVVAGQAVAAFADAG
jgi:decaprenyl-phosphate phosphoribosyltransferase